MALIIELLPVWLQRWYWKGVRDRTANCIGDASELHDKAILRLAELDAQG